jgi:hypothetical protein
MPLLLPFVPACDYLMIRAFANETVCRALPWQIPPLWDLCVYFRPLASLFVFSVCFPRNRLSEGYPVGHADMDGL